MLELQRPTTTVLMFPSALLLNAWRCCETPSSPLFENDLFFCLVVAKLVRLEKWKTWRTTGERSLLHIWNFQGLWWVLVIICSRMERIGRMFYIFFSGNCEFLEVTLFFGREHGRNINKNTSIWRFLKYRAISLL